MSKLTLIGLSVAATLATLWAAGKFLPSVRTAITGA